ncbi:MAG: glycosyltransferase family 87 protein [Rhodospirillales bacterium]
MPDRAAADLAGGRLFRLAWAAAVVLYVVAAAGWIARSRALVAQGLEPVGHDFLAFWSASHVALNQLPADAYSAGPIVAAHHLAYPAMSGYFPWIYPPTFLLAVLPLALLPHLVAYALFVAATFAGYLAVLRRIAPTAAAAFLVAAAPATFANATHGQNGFLTASLLGAAALLLDRRPALAGVAIGLLAYKPHWAMLLPVALAASGRWRAFAAAAATAAAFVLASGAVLGLDTFAGFWRTLPLMRQVTEDGLIPWSYMPTAFSAVRLGGGGIAAAYAVQAASAVAAVAVVAWLWRQPAPVGLQVAGTIAATVLATPYLFDYDLVAVGVALALVAREAWRTGFLPGERPALLLVWLVPLVGTLLAEATAVQAGPLAMALFVAAVVRRARRRGPAPGLAPGAARYA